MTEDEIGGNTRASLGGLKVSFIKNKWRNVLLLIVFARLVAGFQILLYVLHTQSEVFDNFPVQLSSAIVALKFDTSIKSFLGWVCGPCSR